jgi:hypothetical protein
MLLAIAAESPFPLLSDLHRTVIHAYRVLDHGTRLRTM